MNLLVFPLQRSRGDSELQEIMKRRQERIDSGDTDWTSATTSSLIQINLLAVRSYSRTCWNVVYIFNCIFIFYHPMCMYSSIFLSNYVAFLFTVSLDFVVWKEEHMNLCTVLCECVCVCVCVYAQQACNVHICASSVVDVYACCQYRSCLLNDLVNK